MLQCKMFRAKDYRVLEEKVNEWLHANPVSLDTMKTELSTVVVDDEGINEYWLEHVLI